jgi:hypothetical protein
LEASITSSDSAGLRSLGMVLASDRLRAPQHVATEARSR